MAAANAESSIEGPRPIFGVEFQILLLFVVWRCPSEHLISRYAGMYGESMEPIVERCNGIQTYPTD
jgi:hypothetical protein